MKSGIPRVMEVPLIRSTGSQYTVRLSESWSQSSVKAFSSRTIQRPSLCKNKNAARQLGFSQTDLRATYRLKASFFSSTALQMNDSQKKVTPASEPAKKPLTKHENIYTLPNFLTVTRLISAPAIGYLVVQGQTTWALSLFAYSCITDYVDGFIARKYNLQTVVGSVIDPMADKFLMMSLAGTLAISGDIPIYMAVVILGRDFLLGLSAFYFRYISLPEPKTFVRYWDFSIPSAEVHPTTISKYNTLLQMVYLGSSLIYPVLLGSLSVEWATYLSTGLGYLG